MTNRIAEAGMEPYPADALPMGIRSRILPDINGLSVHVLEAGFERPGRPAILLLHGFPELAYSWRKVILPLAAAGYHVIAPDVRGYGRTMGWEAGHDADPGPFALMNLVRDAVALLFALGHRSAAAVLGHDAGSPIAAWAALVRPDIFRSVMLLSTPFPGAPRLPVGTEAFAIPSPGPASAPMDAALAALDPPRRHYVRWYAGAEAERDMMQAPQGLHAFFRAYYHSKSADWSGNTPHRLAGPTAEALAAIPEYYIMRRDRGMAETVRPMMPSTEEIARCTWMTEAEMAVYAGEYARTGFSGALWSYRRALLPMEPERLTHANRRIAVSLCFVSGARDWGTWQTPGAVEAMSEHASDAFRGVHIVPGAGHWVQQEQPQAVVDLTLKLLAGELS